MRPEGNEVTYSHAYHEWDGSTNDPCTYYCAFPFEYDTGFNTCIDPSVDFCWFIHNDCQDGANFVENSDKATYSGNIIIYEWKCKLGSQTRDCKQETSPLECKHCAINGFPYCFPIDFRNDCNEVAWYLY